MEWLSSRHSGYVAGAGETQRTGVRGEAGEENTEGGTEGDGAGSPGCHEDPQDSKSITGHLVLCRIVWSGMVCSTVGT